MADVCDYGLVGPDDWSDDAVWIITSSFMVYTMQSGLALMKGGYVNKKNEIAAMVKVAVSVVMSGLGYWLYGFGLTYGTVFVDNPFIGLGCFFVKAKSDLNMGRVYAPYLFQLSLLYGSQTIMSSTIPERCKLVPFCIFSFFYPIIYCVPARWLWSSHGVLRNLGAFDLAGAGPVHLVGAVSGGVATYILKPSLSFDRGTGRSKKSRDGKRNTVSTGGTKLGSPMSVMLGFLMIWWGWLGMNCGSTFGISGKKWKYAARAAGSTINASISGGVFGLIYSYVRYKRTYDVAVLIKCMMASLVSVTAGSVVIHPWESLMIGLVGAVIGVSGTVFVQRVLVLDDPLAIISVHGLCAIWGILAVGLFAHQDDVLDLTKGLPGVVYSGDFRLIGVQSLLVISCAIWAAVTSFIFLFILEKTMGLRISKSDEVIGSNIVDHDVNEEGEDSTFTAPLNYIPPFATNLSFRSFGSAIVKRFKSNDNFRQ